MTTTIRPPRAHIPRLADWLGPWAMLPTAVDALASLVRGLDWTAHMAEANSSSFGQFSQYKTMGKKLAIVSVTGTMMKSRASTGGTSTVEARAQIRAAAGDADINGILLRIDSPGGTVAGTEALAKEVAQARRSKPVVAQIEDTGASAAYWVASQASRIYASWATTLIGSIGVLMAVQLNKRDEVHVVTSGALKSPGADGSITEEQAAYLQGMVDGLQGEFGRAVSEGRRFIPEQLAKVTTGAVWRAAVALQLRLIDGIQSIEQTLDELAMKS